MATKNNPGLYDCYSRAEPDEPMFVLLGRDPMAGAVVRAWAALRHLQGNESPEKVEEAYKCAKQLDDWAKSLGKEPFVLNRTSLDYRGIVFDFELNLRARPSND